MSISYALHGSTYPLGWVGFLPFWFLLFGGIRTKFPVGIREILTWLPPLLAFSFLAGGVHAVQALGEQGQFTHRLMVIDDIESPHEFNVNVLRAFQDWILVVDDDDHIVWIASASINRMEKLNARE